MLATLLRSIFKTRDSALTTAATASRRLHLGCGRDIREGWINLDASPLPGVAVVADLDDCGNTPLPLPDGSIDEFFGSHVLEHLRNPLPFMQELHRVASDGAKAVFHVPYGSSDDADADPTHMRRYFVNSFHYFSQLAYTRADYGYRGDWEIKSITLTVPAERYADASNEQVLEDIRSQRNVVIEMITTLQAVKPIRTPGSQEAALLRVIINRIANAERRT
jgi:SAM-dependent methyltransferase